MSTTTVVSVQSTPCALENGAMELQRHQSHGSGNEVHRSFPNSTTPPTESVEATPPLDRATVACLISAGYAFFCAGINDGSLGPLIPYLLATYAINTSFVSIFYAVTFAGWLCAALTNTYLTSVLDTGAILAVGAGLQALAHALRVWLPPFSVFATAFFFATLGQGYQDTHANTFVSTVKNAPHRWLGFIHAMYMAGCLVGPFVATSVAAATQPSRWNLFYYFPLGLGSINILFTLWAFRRTVKFKRSVASETRQIRGDSGASEAETSQLRGHRALKEFKETLKLSSVWRLGLFFFFFLGVAITASGRWSSLSLSKWPGKSIFHCVGLLGIADRSRQGGLSHFLSTFAMELPKRWAMLPPAFLGEHFSEDSFSLSPHISLE